MDRPHAEKQVQDTERLNMVAEGKEDASSRASPHLGNGRTFMM